MEQRRRVSRQKPIIPIAKPYAGHRLSKKIRDLIEKSSEKNKLKYGVKDTKKALKNNMNGLCVLGGDVTPMDVITHIPGYCEEFGQPYVFLLSKAEISSSAHRISPVACVFVELPDENDEIMPLYREVISGIEERKLSEDA